MGSVPFIPESPLSSSQKKGTTPGSGNAGESGGSTRFSFAGLSKATIEMPEPNITPGVETDLLQQMEEEENKTPAAETSNNNR